MTADGQPACTPAPVISTPIDRIDDSIGMALVTLLGRRTLLKAAAGGLGTLMLAACSAKPAASPTVGSAPTSLSSASPTSAPTAAPAATSVASPTAGTTASTAADAT